MNRQQLTDLYNKTIANFSEMLNSGAINQEQYQQYLQQTDQEFMQNLNELNQKGEVTFSQPSQQQENANFNSDQMLEELKQISKQDVVSNRFGKAILEVGYGSQYESVAQLIQDIADNTQNTVEDVAGVITGENLPDESFVISMINHFGLEQDEAEDLYNAAAEAHEEYAQMLEEAQIAEQQQNQQQGGGSFSSSEENTSENDNQQAQFSKDMTPEQQKIQQLQEEIASFKAQQQLEHSLQERMNKAQQLVQSGDMPPHVFNLMFGNFDSVQDQIASFSKTAQMNNVDETAELHAIDKTLDIFSKMGLSQYGLFSEFASEDSGEAEFNQQQEQQTDQQARLNVEHRKGRK